MLSEIRQSINPSCKDSIELNNYINSIFDDENLENLFQRLNYRCCNKKIHIIRCLKEWKIMQSQLIEFANKVRNNLSHFLIRKRQKSNLKLLLSETQPNWIQRLFLQGY